MRIDFFKLPTQYGVLDHFRIEFQKALRRQNVASKTIKHFVSEEEYQRYYQATKCTATAVFNWDVPQPMRSATALCHACILVDPLLFHADLLRNTNDLLFCVDQDSVEIALKNNLKAFFLPHAIEKKLVCDSIDSKRSIEILFPGTIYDAEKLKKKLQTHFSSSVYKKIAQYLEAIQSGEDSLYSFLEEPERFSVMYEAIKAFSIDSYYFLAMLELVLRHEERVTLLQKLSDYEVTVVGKVEESIKQRCKGNIRYGKERDICALLPLFKKSRVVVHPVSKAFRNALHERLLYGFACGASVLTESNPYMQQEFPFPLALLSAKENVDKTIQHVLKDEEKRLCDVEKARKVIEERHTWDTRACTVIHEINATAPQFC